MELQNQDKQIILCKVPAQIGIKGKEKADKEVKRALNMPEIIMAKLLYTDYYWPSGELEIANGKGSGKTVLANYTTSNLALNIGKLSITVVGNMRLNWIYFILDMLD